LPVLGAGDVHFIYKRCGDTVADGKPASPVLFPTDAFGWDTKLVRFKQHDSEAEIFMQQKFRYGEKLRKNIICRAFQGRCAAALYLARVAVQRYDDLFYINGIDHRYP